MVKQERAARTRSALIIAAAEVFAEDGYALASLPAISKKAGVSTGALHFHFANKDALAAAVEEAAELALRNLVEECGASATTHLQRLACTINRLLDAVVSDPVTRAGLRLGGDPSRKTGGGVLAWWYGWVGDLLVRAGESGELPEQHSPEGAAAVISAALAGVVLLDGVRGSEHGSCAGMVPFREFLLSWLAVSLPPQRPGAGRGMPDRAFPPG
ncbi:ScbR family autoregulator-binding transcription factor [Streptomyces sp. NPDC057682]|uniref:ScbR family autoregulator-binding transcription factor n=1 Tax=unclassified Streptomyces TaxID=2593676 RepID=UPI00365CA596